MCSPNVHFDTLSIATDPAAGVGFQDTHSHYSPSGLSRKLPSSSSLKPALYHIISNNGTSVLSLAVDEEQGLVFSGSQSECIFVSRALVGLAEEPWTRFILGDNATAAWH